MKHAHNFKDWTGHRFGRLVAVEYAGKVGRRVTTWTMRCDCGVIKAYRLPDVVGGRTKSCGCWNSEFQKITKRTHGKTVGKKTREYIAWLGMKRRCSKPSCKDYPDYGGRGIRVSERWVGSFENFLEDMGPCPEGMSIDRIDTNGDYEKSNCKWSTPTEQANNKRTNRMIEMNGETLSLAQWCRRYNVRYMRVFERLSYGWSLLDALTKPVSR